MTELLEYKCPCCDGKIEFNSSSQKMQCPYCDAEFDPNSLKEYDDVLSSEEQNDFDWENKPKEEWNDANSENMNVYICESCGGEIVGDETLASTKCPFCDSPVIMKNQLSGELRPELLIPFKLDKKAAKEALNNHIKGKKLLPKVFKQQNHIDEIKGLYVPFWLFDCEANANICYKAENISSWSDSTYNYTKTSVYSVYREGSLGFSHIPVDSSTKMPNDLTESIEPFDFNEAIDFQTAYLSGYLTDKYDVSSDDCMERANDRVKQSTVEKFKETVNGYTTVLTKSSNISLSNGTVRYALLPVWILNTTWNKQKYVFIMNGQTGKFAGNLPMDKGLFCKYFFIITLIAGVIVYGGAWLLRLFGVF